MHTEIVGRTLIILLALLHSFCSYPAESVLTATVNKNTVAVGEQFQLTYSLNGNGKNFTGPDLSDFVVLGGPSQSSQIQIINGNYSQSISYTYFLQPKAEGTFKIGFASIDVDGKRIQSNGIIINVVKGSQNTAKSNSGNQETGITDKHIFLRAEVNKSNVYQGEALTVTFKLYTSISIVNYTISKAPSLTGFWNQDIDLPEQLQLQTVNIDGINYKVGVLKKVVLFPQQNGTLTIDPMELECIARVQVKGRNRMDPFGMFQNDPFFNDPFFGMGNARDVKVAFKSNPVSIKVRPLPDQAPASFNGTVGQLSFNAALDKNETKANEPVSLKIRISGSGNLKLAEPPAIEFPADIEAYEPKITDNLRASESGVNGNKTIEYLLIPRHEGTYELQPVTFSYFDLAKKQYISKTAGPFKLKVGRGISTGAGMAGPSVSKSDFQLLGKDIRYIKLNNPAFITATGDFYGSLPFYALMITPFLALGGLAWVRQRKIELAGDVAGMKSRKATAMAKKRLAAAQKLLAEGKHSSLYEEITKAMWGYAGDRLSIQVSALSKERLENAFAEKNVSPELIKTFVNTLDQAEMARYAGLSSADSGQLYKDALNSISDIEQSLKS